MTEPFLLGRVLLRFDAEVNDRDFPQTIYRGLWHID